MMDELILEDFQARRLPAGWFSDSPHYRFTPEGLHTGRETGFVIQLPGHGWEALRVEVAFNGEGGSSAYCAWDGVLGLSLTLGDTPYPRHEASDCHTVYAHSTTPLPPRGEGEQRSEGTGGRRVTFDFDRRRMVAAVDGHPILGAANRRGGPLTGAIHMAFRGDAVIRRIRILGEGALAAPLYSTPPKSDAGYFLEAAVDFPDDLLCAPYDQAMFDAYFAELASWGTRRVHWIFNGRREEGQLDHWPLGGDVNAARTMEQVGELFEAAVHAAHRHGMQIFAIVKPIEMGFYLSYGEGTPEARQRGRLDRIGGPVGWITHFAAQRRDLVMARRPRSGSYGGAVRHHGSIGREDRGLEGSVPATPETTPNRSRNETFTRIDLVKEDDQPAAITPQDVTIFVSDDNTIYRPYTGPIQHREVVEDVPVYIHTPSGPRPTHQRRLCRVIRLDGLDLRAKYTALVVPGNRRSFANRLLDLLHVHGEQGEEHMLTYAAKVRTADYHYGAGLRPFDQVGLEFDHYPGSPTAGYGGGYDAIRAPFILDGGICPAAVAPTSWRDGQAGDAGHFTVLAFAHGKEHTTLAALSPSFEGTRRWWLSWVKDALDMGADGIELRVGNHHADFAFGELGFEPPVREAFLERHGVDIWATDDFDPAALRRLRGKAYTQFYREAHQLIKGRGKLMGIHVEASMDTEPEIGGAMGMHWDWRTWLAEGLADSVTMKSVWPGSRLAQEILSLTRPRGIRTIFSPYANNYFSPPTAAARKAGGEKAIEGLIEMGRWGGCDGFQFYEAAAAMQATQEGEVRMAEPALREVFRRHFAAGG